MCYMTPPVQEQKIGAQSCYDMKNGLSVMWFNVVCLIFYVVADNMLS